MDAINYVYNRKLWKASCTLSDKNSFFHAAFGVVTNESGPYLDKRVKFRRMRWATFLTYFEDETMPPCLADILKKCLSASDKHKHVKDQCQVDNYVNDIMKAAHDVVPEEIPILATLENIKIILFKDGESEPVIIINPDFEILGSYPNSEKPKREAVLQLKGNVFSKMNSVEEDPALKSVKDEIVDLEDTKNSTEQIGSGLIRYKKSGSAGSEGVQFQVGLLTIFFLNAIQKLRNWQLSTENKAAGKFDDVVLEWPEGATLLQAKHKQNKSKKITFEELISTNSKNDDFSLPKYFLSYKEIKKTFKLKEVIICTNASVDGNTIKFLKAQKVPPESMLHYENSDCKLYTFSDEILPYLKENIKIYYKKNFQNKDFEGLDITNENIKDFLGHLQFYSNYPPGNNVGKIVEQLLSHMNLLKNSYDAISPLEIYTKILDWFQQKDGIYLTDLYATAIFSEIWRDKHWQRLEKYNVFFQCNNLNLQNAKRMLHVIADDMCLLQEIKISRTLQNNKTKILLISPDDGTENQKQVIDAFSLPQYTTLVIISPKFTEESVIKEVSCKLKQILDKYEYKNVVLIANCNNKASYLIGLHNNHYYVKNDSITFEDLSLGTQASLLKKENIIFQGRGISLEELLATPAIEDYSKLLNYEILEKLVRDEKIYVGAPLLELDEHISQFYIQRRFKRGIKKNKYEKTKFAMGEVFPEELICEMNEKILLISDSAGTGKSTVLTNLSVTIKKKYPHLWIIRIDLKDYTQILKDFLRINRKTINILDLLNSKYLTKFTNQLEEAVFSMKGKVVLLLDGFDEISPDYTQLVLSLLSLCREQQNFVKMFVTTRPHAALELEEKLQVEPFILQPFTEQNQIDFLTGYWMHNLNVDNIYRNKCQEYAKALIKMSCWVQLIQQGANHFAAIPLHVQMLAEIFQENNQLEISEDWEGCKEYLVADEVEPKLPESMNVTILYKMFIKKKQNVFVDKGNPSGNTAANRALIDQFEECFVFHRSLALELILGTRCELFLCYRQTPIDLEMNVLKIGIIQKLDNEFHFVHRTFAEYFVAESLIEELQLPNQNVEFQRFLIEEILLDLQFNVIRVFLNNFLQQIIDDLSCKTFHKYQSISYEITSSDMYKFNLLHYLAENGQLAILQLILKCIDLNFITKVPITSEQLFEAALEENDSERVHGNILNTIHTCVQQEGLDVKDIFQDKTLLEYAAVNGHLEMVKFLVKQGSNVNFGNFKPLHLSVDGGHFEVSKFLIEQEADIKARDPYHHTTTLYKAVLRNDITMATYLLDTTFKSGGSNISDSITPYTAAYLGRLNTLKEFVKQGLDINSRVENEESVIFGAVRGGQLETIRYLVQQGSHINSRDLWNNTVLHIISQNASITSTVKLLVELGIDINAKNFNLMTALHIAVENSNFDLIDLLVNCGANVNLGDENGNTALHIAASDIQGYIIKLLVEHGANMNNGDKYGRTPLHLVTLNSATLFKNSNEQSLKYYENSIAPMDHLDIIKLLIEHGGDVNVRDSNGYSALHLAASSGQLDIAHLLMEFGADANIKDKDGRTALHLAAFRDHTDIIELLMQHNGDINIQDNEGYTIIHYLLFFVDQLDILKLIIEKGGNVNIRDKNGCTALHLTTRWGNLDAVILLVEFGIDVNVTDIEGSTALHVAVNKGHFSIIEYLVKIGVDVTVRDNCGHTVLHLAIEACSSDVISPIVRLPHHYNDIVDVNDCTMQYLTFNAVDIGATNFDDCLDSTNMEPRGKKLYLDIINTVVTRCGEVVDIKDGTGCTALHLAVLKGQLEVVKLLVEHNTDVNIKGHRCCTALHLAVKDDRLDIVKLLVEYGAVVNNQDIDNNTALHIAAREGHKEIVKFLVECNAIIDIKDRDGGTSLHKAVEGSNLDIVRFLIENGSDVNIADNRSVTALHIAAGWNLHLVMFLVEQGADIYVEDCTGDTPAIVAKRKGRIDVFKYLQQEQSLRNRLFY